MAAHRRTDDVGVLALVVAVVAVVVLASLVVLEALDTRSAAATSRRDQQWALDVLRADELVVLGAGGEGVVVAVLDTAIAAGHQDLAGVLVPGHDFIEDRPFDPDAPDRRLAASDHGTMVASIIAAPDDGVGTSGLAPGVRIMPVRIVPDVGQGTAGDMAAGIEWALDNGADVINVSIRTTRDSAAVRAAVERAEAMGVPVVASAGLAPTDVPFFPAAYASTIAVGAVDADVAHHPGSPVAPYVDVVAPGVGIVAAAGGAADAHASGTGTSFAAPYVAATIANAIAGRTVDVDTARAALFATAVDLGAPGRDDAFGYGLIDPVGTFAALAGPPSPPAVSLTGFGNKVVVRWSAPPSPHVVAHEIVAGGVRVRVEAPGRVAVVPRGHLGRDLVVAVEAHDSLGRVSPAASAVLVAPAGRPPVDPLDRLRRPAASTRYWLCDACYPSDVERLRGY